jgi:NAD(P)H-dependent FMN reductase
VPHLLTVAGSLRAGSSNAALLGAAAALAPAGVTVAPYTALAALPAFNPDLEEPPAPVPDAVRHWRAALAAADGVLLSTPEYAHGVPGALKNAFDWVVGSGELVGKPVALLNASAASRFAHPQLVEILTVMSAVVVPAASPTVDLPRRGLDAGQLAGDAAVAPILRQAVAALVAALAPRADQA